MQNDLRSWLIESNEPGMRYRALIDIEGFEIGALEGARNLIRNRGSNLGIVVEMHPSGWHHADTSLDEAVELFDELGLRPVPLVGQKDPLNDYGLVYLEHVDD